MEKMEAMATTRWRTTSSRIEISRVKTFDREVSLRFLLRPGERPTAGAVKLKLIEALKLKQSSIAIFGIYLGTPGNSSELLLDSTQLPESSQDVCFQRAPFYKDEELKIVKEDHVALKLIFLEASHAYKCGKILPKLDASTAGNLENKLQLANGASPPTAAGIMGFMSIIYSIPHFFWSFYYRVEYCALQCSVTVNGQKLLEGTEMQVAMSIEELIFLDVQGKREVATWFWDEVHMLRLQRNKSSLHVLTFEVVNEDKEIGKDVFHNVALVCEQSEYLYSMGVYILTVLEKRMHSEHGRSEIINSGYRKKLLPAKPRADAYSFQGRCEEELENP